MPVTVQRVAVRALRGFVLPCLAATVSVTLNGVPVVVGDDEAREFLRVNAGDRVEFEADSVDLPYVLKAGWVEPA